MCLKFNAACDRFADKRCRQGRGAMRYAFYSDGGNEMLRLTKTLALVLCVVLSPVRAAESAAPSPSVKALMALAEQGNAVAQNDLGVMYQAGTGVPQNFAEAVKWLRKSAEQGFA